MTSQAWHQELSFSCSLTPGDLETQTEKLLLWASRALEVGGVGILFHLFIFAFLGPHSQPVKGPRPGVESEL